MNNAQNTFSLSNKLFTLTVAAGWTAAISLIMLANIKDSPFAESSIVNKSVVSLITPQGWAFFTKNPREEQVRLLHLATDGSLQETALRDLRQNPLVALNRANRAEDMAIGQYSRSITEADWFTCNNGIEECDTSTLKEIKVLRSVSNSTICGHYYIAVAKPVPWAWAKLTTWKQQPTKLAKIFVQCDGLGG